jgi:hypothetical protein
MRRTALIPLLLLSLAAIAAAPAADQLPRPTTQPAARTPQLTAEPSAVRPGETFTLRGRGFPRNAHVALLAELPQGQRTRIGGALTGRAGRFTATIHIRPRSAPGTFVARACVDACQV